jgi:DNA polymerase-3 subunit epsilon
VSAETLPTPAVDAKRLFANTRILVLDIETTGLDRTRDSVIELGVIEVVDGEITRAGEALFGGGSSSPETVAVHGISDETRAGKPTFMEKSAHFKSYIEQTFAPRHTILCGHNIRDFDLPFLLVAAKKAGHPLASPVDIVDTLRLARQKLNAPSNKLSALCSAFGITHGGHRGLGDSMSTWLLLQVILQKINAQHINEVVERIQE